MDKVLTEDAFEKSFISFDKILGYFWGDAVF
jgi:hypothetical protein